MTCICSACHRSRTGTTLTPITRARLRHDLERLGLERGSVVLVHSSLSRIGWVVGGAVAVVQALLDVVGPTGTVAVPTMTADNSDPRRWGRTSEHPVPEAWWEVIRDHLPAFSVSSTPSSGMGAVAETVRTWPGAVRSEHPQSSFAAIGPQARTLMRDHDRTCHLGERSPLRRLEEDRASVLLLGVGYDVCSCFHLAEYRQALPPIRDYECVVLDSAGERLWFRYEDVALREDDFGSLGAAFEAAEGQRIRTDSVGDSTAKLFPIRDAVGFATEWLAMHRDEPV